MRSEDVLLCLPSESNLARSLRCLLPIRTGRLSKRSYLGTPRRVQTSVLTELLCLNCRGILIVALYQEPRGKFTCRFMHVRSHVARHKQLNEAEQHNACV